MKPKYLGIDIIFFRLIHEKLSLLKKRRHKEMKKIPCSEIRELLFQCTPYQNFVQIHCHSKQNSNDSLQWCVLNISKISLKSSVTHIFKEIQTAKKIRGILFPEFKLSNNATTVKLFWYCSKSRQTSEIGFKLHY